MTLLGKKQMQSKSWTEDLIIEADKAAQRPGTHHPMSYEEREAILPPMVLRQTKVGGASIKTSQHPTYQQAWDQYPNVSGTGSSTDAVPRRYPVRDHIRHHEDEWQEDWQDDWQWKGAHDEDYEYPQHKDRQW